MKQILERCFSALSPGAWVILLLAAVSSLGVALVRVKPRHGIQFWIFATLHQPVYKSVIAQWNRTHPASQQVQLTLVNPAALQQRMLSAFFSGTPIGDVIEIERDVVGPAFAGPLQDVGFDDLTDRLKADGLYARINPPSFSPWTSRGRIFGLPHDMHPALLVYRADLVAAAGIDVSQIKTWDDYFRVMHPLLDPAAGRYLLDAWPTNWIPTEMLLLEAGVVLIDAHGRPTLNAPFNTRFLSRLATWCVGPGRVTTDVDYFSASGHQLMQQGIVVGWMAPDWYAGTIEREIPGLAGKVKVMPLPAWAPGGRRTSVVGGTMLGIPKSSRHQKTDWEFAKFLYTSPQMAVALFKGTGIVSPIKSNWSNPVYDEPNAYFCGQPVGRLYLDQAPDIPVRSSSPYYDQAMTAFNNCLFNLVAYAERHHAYTIDALAPEAQRLLNAAQGQIQRQIDRNVFLSTTPSP